MAITNFCLTKTKVRPTLTKVAKTQRQAVYPLEIESEQEAWVVSIARQAGSISKAELARRTGLSRAALAARLRTLQGRHLIEDVGLGESSGGRPPTMVRYGKDSGWLVCVDVGATSVDVALTNLDAEPLMHLEEALDVGEGPAKVLPRISALVERALAESGIERSRVKGLGIGVPGPVEFSTGHPISPPIMPGWNLYPLREFFENEFGWPVFVDNDVNIMALGERWAGLGRTTSNFLFVKLGTGIGCGIVARGQIYRGADGCAGDIGHMQAVTDGTPCRCGNTGCLEAVAGGLALARAAEEAAHTGRSAAMALLLRERGALTAADLALMLHRGDPVAVEIVRGAGAQIGGVLAGLVSFFNPNLVIIGGGVANVGDILLASIREAVYRRSLPLATRNLQVQRSSLGSAAGVIGAAAMVLGELYRLQPAAVTA